MKQKKVIVTGGAGFIGSNLVASLVKDDNEVLVIDDLSTGNIKNIQGYIDKNDIQFCNTNINEYDQLKKIFEGVDYIFHEAAIPSVPRSIDDPLSSTYANVNGTLHVLKAAVECDVKKVIFASSSSVYGDSPTLPKHEDMKPNPLSPYAVDKLAGEYYCTVFHNVYGLETIILRYFNVFGPNQDPFSQYSAVIPRFIHNILKKESPTIYGDGEQSRDFTYVKNVADANIQAAEHPSTGIFNIACGSRITIKELAHQIMDILDIQVDCKYTDERAGDVKHSLADITKAEHAFQYRPKYSIKEGLEETIQWLKTTM